MADAESHLAFTTLSQLTVVKEAREKDSSKDAKVKRVGASRKASTAQSVLPLHSVRTRVPYGSLPLTELV